MHLSKPIPFIDLRPQVALVREALGDTWDRILRDVTFFGGPARGEFESALGKRLDANHVLACSNGTDALRLALQAAGVMPGDLVALPNVTFWATYEAIVELGAIPVLVDIDPDDLQMSFEAFWEAHKKHAFRFAVLVHLFGWCSGRTFEFRSTCNANGITLVEDAAQAFGVEIYGESVFKGAEWATLSFYPAKVLGGATDGGAVLTSREEYREKVALLAHHGRTGHYAHAAVGWNARMNNLQATYLTAALQVIDPVLARRRALADRYREKLRDVSGLRLSAPSPGIAENGYLSVTRIFGRPHAAEECAASLETAAISTARTYPISLDAQAGASTALNGGTLRESRAFVESVLNLPLYYGLTDEQQDYVCEQVLGLFQPQVPV